MTLAKKQIIGIGFIFHLLAAYFSVGYHQCDELFQVFEFAGFKLGINKIEEMPWEFASQMRSGIEPLLVFSVTKAYHFFNNYNPFNVALFLRLIVAMASFLAVLKLISQLEEELINEKSRNYLWGFGLLFWCLPYFHVRLSSENFSSLFFIIGLTIVLQNLKQGKPSLSLLFAGFSFGLSFVCRFQFAFMIAGLFAWLMWVRKPVAKYYVKLVSGLFLALLVGMFVDQWLYGKWTLSWWNYLSENLFQNKASRYGESPFYFYISEALLQLIPPFSIVLVIGIFGFWAKFQRHFLTWITIPFIVLHFFVAHKELRFLFPILNFIPFMLILYLQTNQNNPNKFWQIIQSNMLMKTGVAVNLILLCFFTFKPADDTSKCLERIYNLVVGERAILFYEGTKPYNNQASLNYFRNPTITLRDLNTESAPISENENAYFFSEKFGESSRIEKNGRKFVRIYSYFPSWFAYLNFNGWLDRAYSFSIYKLEQDF